MAIVESENTLIQNAGKSFHDIKAANADYESKGKNRF